MGEKEGLLSRVPMHAKWTIEKYTSEEAYKVGAKPFEISTFKENKFLIEGINEIWDLVCTSGSPTAYSSANARVGVGNSSAAEDESQTGLQGASTAFVAMESGYPDTATDFIAKFRGSYDGNTANFAWNEFTVDNGSTANKNLNRKVSAQGTKVSGQTWVLTVELSITNPS